MKTAKQLAVCAARRQRTAELGAVKRSTHYVLLLWSIIDAIQGLWSQNDRNSDFMVVGPIKRAYFSSGKRLDLQIGL